MNKILNLRNRNNSSGPHSMEVYVDANAHCNLDSLPLRFGFNFDRSQIITLEVIGPKMDAKRPDRFLVEAWIVNPETNEKLSGTFILTNEKSKGAHSLVTAWRHEADSEFYLSEVIRMLRKQGSITPEWLKANHRLYVIGDLRTHADLIRIMAAELSLEAQRQLMKSIDDLKKKLEEIQRENDRLKAEAVAASDQGNALKLSRSEILVEVQEAVDYRGSQCTRLLLADGSAWHMKTSTFDRSGSITQKAKSLEGKRIRVSSWDPVDKPGLWSSQGYFRNIYLDSSPQ